MDCFERKNVLDIFPMTTATEIDENDGKNDNCDVDHLCEMRVSIKDHCAGFLALSSREKAKQRTPD